MGLSERSLLEQRMTLEASERIGKETHPHGGTLTCEKGAQAQRPLFYLLVSDCCGGGIRQFLSSSSFVSLVLCLRVVAVRPREPRAASRPARAPRHHGHRPRPRCRLPQRAPRRMVRASERTWQPPLGGEAAPATRSWKSSRLPPPCNLPAHPFFPPLPFLPCAKGTPKPKRCCSSAPQAFRPSKAAS